MTHDRLRASPAVLALALLAAPAAAQLSGSSRFTFVGPDVSLISGGQETSAASVNAPIVAGDAVETGAESEAEAILADGTLVRFGSDTSAHFDTLARTFESGDEKTLLSLDFGALAIEARATTNAERVVRVDTDEATIVVPREAFVRVDRTQRGTLVTVRSGRAELRTPAGDVVVLPGASAWLEVGKPVEVTAGDLPKDAFTRFCEERRVPPSGTSLARLKSASAGNPWDDDAFAYSASLLDAAGTWVTTSGCGRGCFHPNVGADWQPFSSGRWDWTPSGLTWVPDDSWEWLTSHYGRWLYDAKTGWCWCPGWDYSPAWVFWGYTDEWVGWCPMGFLEDGGAGGTGVRWEPNNGKVRARIDFVKVDPRGWSWMPRVRLATKAERGEIVRGDRPGFRPGRTGIVTAERLQVARKSGEPIRARVADAVQTLHASAPAKVDSRVTAIFRHAPASQTAADHGMASAPSRGSGSSSSRSRYEPSPSPEPSSHWDPSPAPMPSPSFDAPSGPAAQAPAPTRG